MAGKLYVVGTPIGNLGDLTARAAQVLEEVDFIAAEDTRVTIKLLNHLGIKKPITSYFAHSPKGKGDQILSRILDGETCAIVTDAGMPCISDPGEELVAACHEQGIRVEPIPGPTAALTALAVSGQATSRFRFEGFISVNGGSRRKHLEEIRGVEQTMIFYEAPHKLCRTLADLLEALGDRSITLCRELTKLHEEIIKTTLAQAVAYYKDHPPIGEFVLVVAGNPVQEREQLSLEEAADLAARLVEGGKSLSEAAKEASRETSYSKSSIYKAFLEREKEN